MLSVDEVKLINLNLKDFPLMAAASAAIKGCSTCAHKRINANTTLRAAVLSLKNKPLFVKFIKANFKCPVVLGGHVFQ